MNKKQVLETTINVLSNICVPVSKKDEIADPISGCIGNLCIVLQMMEEEEKINQGKPDEGAWENGKIEGRPVDMDDPLFPEDEDDGK